MAALELDQSQLVSIQLMPTNRCPHNCTFCLHRNADNPCSTGFDPAAQLSPTALCHLIDDAEALGVQGIEVTGGGEPTVYEHSRVLWDRLACSTAKVGLVTNGARIDTVDASVLTWARVSIDAATRGKYKRIHGVDKFDTAWAALASLWLGMGQDIRLGASMIITPDNVSEVAEFYRLTANHGAHYARYAVEYGAHVEPGQWVNDAHHAVEAIPLQKSRFRTVIQNQIPQRQEEMQLGAPTARRCHISSLQAVITADGGVYPCCSTLGREDRCYGNINEERFRDIWQREADKREHEPRMTPQERCKHPCAHNRVNLGICEFLGRRAEHSEWV